MAAPSAKEQYEAEVKLLGGKTRARKDSPWQLAALKRKYATQHSGAATLAMLASAEVIEAEARARNVPRPAALGGGGGGGGGGGSGTGSGSGLGSGLGGGGGSGLLCAGGGLTGLLPAAQSST